MDNTGFKWVPSIVPLKIVAMEVTGYYDKVEI